MFLKFYVGYIILFYSKQIIENYYYYYYYFSPSTLNGDCNSVR